MTFGFIFDIRRYSIHDGPGIRTAVFFKGCPARCLWCHNPEGQEFAREIMFWQKRCSRCGACYKACPSGAIRNVHGYPVVLREVCSACGECVEACPFSARAPVGRDVTVDQVMQEIERDRVFYDESSGGVTFSGGEPLAQPEFLEALLAACRAVDIDTAVDTSGIAEQKHIQRILPLVDVWLYDLKTVDPVRHMEVTGCVVDPVLENLRLLTDNAATVILRIPIIPGVNTDTGGLDLMREFISSLDKSSLDRLDLLPYHEIGLDKYLRLGREYTFKVEKVPTEKEIGRIADFFRKTGLQVKVGG